jgi:Acyl-CoA dehydrogenase, C-terminal domain
MEPADQELFERSLHHAVASHTGAALDGALSDLGWLDVLELDAPAAVSALFELLGSTLVSSSALDAVLIGSLGLPTTPAVGFVLPALGRWDPPGLLAEGRLIVNGLTRAGGPDQGELVVVARANARKNEPLIAVVVPTADLRTRPVRGMDPDLELAEFTGDLAFPDRRSDLAAAAWSAALTRGRLAVAHELVGASRQMLELARQHALDRTQFGQAIGKFQAVRHRLAEALVAIESAAAMLEAAWEDGSPTTAALAKALAGRSARTTARHCQQVLAGIGFTTEHDFHRFFRRVLVLDALLGASRSLTEEFGTALLRTRQLPHLVLLSERADGESA